MPVQGSKGGGQILNSVIRHQVLLERLKMAEARDFNRLLTLLQTQILEVVTSLRGTTLADMTRGQLNGMLRQLKAAQTAALKGSQDALIHRLQMIAEYEANFETQVLTDAGGETPAPIKPIPGSAAWSAATTIPLSATGDLLEPFVRDMTAAEVEMINKVIMRGYSEGWTNDELYNMLRGTKGMNYTDGLLPKMGKHNQAIVRTAVQHVSSAARQEVWKNNSDILTAYRWVSTLDSRTSQQCRSLDGQEFPVGKGPLPPIHINCRSTTIGVLGGELGRLLSEGRTRASETGLVDSNKTYYDWLKEQDQEFQEGVLGPTRAAMFNKPDMTPEKFAKMQLGSTFQPLTLEQMALVEAAKVAPTRTPNLPRAWEAAQAGRLTGQMGDDAEEAFMTYTGDDGFEINNDIRTRASNSAHYGDIREMVAYLESDSSALTMDVDLYRGVDIGKFFGVSSDTDIIGMEFEEGAFMSFSIDKTVAGGYANSADIRAAVFVLRANKGDRGFASLEHVTMVGEEMEVVRKGGRYKILRQLYTDQYYYEIVLLP